MIRRRTVAGSLAALVALAAAGALSGQAPEKTVTPPPRADYTRSAEDDAFLEDLSKRSFRFFWDEADPGTGIVRDRARTDGSALGEHHRFVGSIASTGFGLSGLCIAAERGWRPRAEVVERAKTTLRFFAERSVHDHGWFYHFVDIRNGERAWKSELSSIDTALLLGGVLTVRQCFKDDEDVARLADAIYRRVDFPWMLNGHPTLLSHGRRPETGWITHRWDHFSELQILYVLGLASPTAPLPPASWAAWTRPLFTYGPYTYVHTVPPLFIHQYSHAWIDFRGWRDPVPPQPDWFANSTVATYAQRQFFIDLQDEFPGYGEHLWGVTASDTRKGYKAWGGPPRHPALDGSIVPCAAGGSLAFAPAIAVPALREMHRRFGDRIYGRYGFADAFHPTDGWVNPDVIGIDVGMTLLAAENLRTGNVWRWFMANEQIPGGMRRAGLTR